MSDRYLLPCTCGQHVVVEPRQAGTTVTCTCGRSLEVPTIRGITQLARAENVEEVLPPLWTLRHGIVFLGLAIALPAFAFAIYLYSQIPTLHESNITEYIQKLSPSESWMLWRAYADGMPKAASPETKAVVQGIQTLQRWINLAVLLGAAGLLMSAAALFFHPQRARRGSPRLATGNEQRK